MEQIKEAISKAGRALWKSLPMVLGTILLVGLISALIPKSFYLNLFHGEDFSDSLIGALVGSISAGTPITSYIFGGELLKQGVSLIAVTAFLVSWVTVGVIQLPAESAILGKKFALIRNAASFVFAIVVALAAGLIIGGGI